MQLNLDELWETLYALEDKAYAHEENNGDKKHIEYLKSIAKKVDEKIKNWEA